VLHCFTQVIVAVFSALSACDSFLVFSVSLPSLSPLRCPFFSLFIPFTRSRRESIECAEVSGGLFSNFQPTLLRTIPFLSLLANDQGGCCFFFFLLHDIFETSTILIFFFFIVLIAEKNSLFGESIVPEHQMNRAKVISRAQGSQNWCRSMEWNVGGILCDASEAVAG
jgi:hypothetical protein